MIKNNVIRFILLLFFSITTLPIYACSNQSLSISQVNAAYTVSFNSNGGTGLMNDIFDVNGEFILPDCTFVAPEDKYFAGWKQNNKGDLLQPHQTTAINQNITFYACWKSYWYVEYGVSKVPNNTVAYAKYNTFSKCFIQNKDFIFKQFAICTIGETEYSAFELFANKYDGNIDNIVIVDNNDLDGHLPKLLTDKHHWMIVTFRNELLIKDAFQLYDELEKKSFVCFVYEIFPPRSDFIPATLPIPYCENSKMSKAIERFDFEHDGFMDGYYKNIYVSVKHEYSELYKDISDEQLLPSIKVNNIASFTKITTQNDIFHLNKMLPQESTAKSRDWYRIEFDYRYEAQYAFSLLKTLDFGYVSYFAIVEKCEDESVAIEKVEILNPFTI